MARKPVLKGGKRDEIIDEAMKLFFEKGYEATSVRMIMNRVGGEIGMFYHYFKSKDELFERVVDRFFQGYEEKFGALIRQCRGPGDFVDSFLPMYAGSMAEFGVLRGKMHWTMQYAMSARTVMSLRPVVAGMLEEWKTQSGTAADSHEAWKISSGERTDILAGQLLYGISATIHSMDFEKMSLEEKRDSLLSFVRKVLE